MTQEEKQLLLADLCARLPYGVNFQSGLNNESSFKITAGEWWEGERERITYILSHIQEFKYYLRPMSSMTEEERKEYESFFSIGEYSCGGSLYGEEYEYIRAYYDDVTQSISLNDWLNAHHFDYRGLIPMGLALEAKEGMYE